MVKKTPKMFLSYKGIEVFFKVCKSYMNLSKECRAVSYDAITVHTAIVFTRYMMLFLESCESNDDRSLGKPFLCISDEMSRALLTDNIGLSDEKIDGLMDTFMATIPPLFRSRLQTA